MAPPQRVHHTPCVEQLTKLKELKNKWTGSIFFYDSTIAMINIVKLDRSTASRSKRIGDMGEQLAESILKNNGFVGIKNLNYQKMNFAFADFYAERNAIKYVISVKARNKYEFRRDGTTRINGRYKLGSKCLAHAASATQQFEAQAAWLTIAISPETYSAYFGLLSELKSSGVPMTEKATSSYECLANNEPHKLDYASILNIYEMRGL